VLLRIEERPESFALWRGPVRRALLKRFPFSAAFVVDENHIYVLGLVHGKRNLPKWIDRRLTDEQPPS